MVALGDQCWFAENLRAEHYANGDAIPGNLSDSEWTSTTSGAQTVYGEGSSAVYAGSDDEAANLANYGRLYNWYAIDDARGICPSGWRYNLGYFNGGQSSAVWWSATPGGALGVWGRRLDSDNGDVNRSGGNARSGHAVRCLGD